jgi:hypothetical protein
MRPAVLPLGASAIAGLAAWYFEMQPAVDRPEDRIAFASAIASVSVTMLGFMLAALAVLASINHVHLVSMMKKTGHYIDLLVTIFIGAIFFLLCGLFGYAILFGYVPRPHGWALLASVHVGALFALLDVGRKLWMVLSHLRSQD